MILTAVSFEGELENIIDEYLYQLSNGLCDNIWSKNDDSLKKVKKHIKEHYLNAQDYTCSYCKQRIEVGHNAIWDIEHIIPKDKYPNFIFEPMNLCVVCKDCNLEKRNKDVLTNTSRKTFPIKSEDYLIIHPHFDDYRNHMKILNSSLFFIPLDRKGKETIETCGLLRFLYKFSDYGNVPLEIKAKIGSMQQELMESNSPMMDNFILSCIGDLVEKGKELSKKKLLGSDVNL